MKGDAFKAAMEEQAAIDKLVKDKIELAATTENENSQSANISIFIMITFTVIGVIRFISSGES